MRIANAVHSDCTWLKLLTFSFVSLTDDLTVTKPPHSAQNVECHLCLSSAPAWSILRHPNHTISSAGRDPQGSLSLNLGISICSVSLVWVYQKWLILPGSPVCWQDLFCFSSAYPHLFATLDSLMKFFRLKFPFKQCSHLACFLLRNCPSVVMNIPTDWVMLSPGKGKGVFGVLQLSFWPIREPGNLWDPKPMHSLSFCEHVCVPVCAHTCVSMSMCAFVCLCVI